MHVSARVVAAGLVLLGVGAGDGALGRVFMLGAPEARIAVKPNWVTVFPYEGRGAAVSYRFDKEGWKKAPGDDQKISAAVVPACEAADDQDISTEREIRDVLPRNARVKAAKRVPGGRVVVVYSIVPPPGRGSGHVELWLAILVPGKDGKLAFGSSTDLAHPEASEGFCRLSLLEGSTALVITSEAIADEMGLGVYAVPVGQ